MSNNNYPLDEKALEEQYADLLLKIALKEYLKEQALQMKQQEAEAAPAPQPAQESSNVVAVAFRQVGLQETKETLLHGLKKGVTRVAVVFLAAAQAALGNAELQRDLAQLALRRTEIRSPIRGIPAVTPFSVGDTVSEGQSDALTEVAR